MRLLLIGAFPYPHDQGSQVYLQEQAIALRAAGADVTLLTYGAPTGPGAVPAGRDAAEHWRALDGFAHRGLPEWARPRSLRSGPNLGKPLADLRLAMTLNDALASERHGVDAFDAILTHNAEAALLTLLSLRRRGPPVVYCAHTLLGEELVSYANDSSSIRSLIRMTQAMTRIDPSRGPSRLGDALDRWIAGRVDGWIALTQSAGRVMAQHALGPGRVIPPPLADPERAATPDRARRVCARHGLDPGRFFLYVGNLDGYQSLETLEETGRILAARSSRPPGLVVATHRRAGDSGGRGFTRRGGAAGGALGIRWLESAAEMQTLLRAARACLVPRRISGGFPIKLVNALALATPPITFLGRDWGLEHDENALVCSGARPAEALADAIERLADDDALAARLASGARALYLARHRPAEVAAETLAYLEGLVSNDRARRA